jgi:hypothetical protein
MPSGLGDVEPLTPGFAFEAYATDLAARNSLDTCHAFRLISLCYDQAQF